MCVCIFALTEIQQWMLCTLGHTGDTSYSNSVISLYLPVPIPHIDVNALNVDPNPQI